jgi:hypothetical protein
MIAEKTKARMEELPREELIAVIYELMDKIQGLEEQLRAKQTPTTS